MTVPYFTKVLGGPTGRTISEGKALPLPRYGPGAFASSAGPGGVGPAGAPLSFGVAPAPLPVALLAGKDAQRGGYGPSLRRDGRVPCMDCTLCRGRRYNDCQHATSQAEARLHHAQAHDPDAATDYASALLELVAAELSFGLAR